MDLPSVHSLYVHVPFCARKCEYCAFYSEPGDGELKQRYLRALTREFNLVASRLRPGTVFFGGGTPSLLTLAQWRHLLETMERLGLLGAAEWSIECNPATVSLEKAQLWRGFGVNRISMGVQSLDESLLDRLGRVHSRQMVFQSYDILRRAGFENINLDLMFAIPGQTLAVWRSTLHEAISLQSEHLSCYEVIYEEDTPLFAQLQAGQIDVDEDLACAMYDELLEQAAVNGFVQYEVANFAKNESPASSRDRDAGSPAPKALPMLPGIPSRACRHNINYWLGGSYHGLGPSAAEYVDGVRAKNVSNTIVYCEQLERGERPIEWREVLSPIKRAGETAAFGLRMNVGWSFRRFQETTGLDLAREWKMELEQLVAKGWGCLEPDRFRLNQLGLRFADAAGELLLR